MWRVGLNAIVTKQRQVKHFQGYDGLSNSATWLSGNQEWGPEEQEGQCV
jgi:hypothetical protein